MKFPHRRQFLHLAAGAAALPAVSRLAWAQTYPTRPITMIVPLAAGGLTDVVGRVVADRMTKSIGQPIILENISGADGSIGVGRAARARPDGYTIVLGFFGSHVVNGAYYSLPYDVINDFAPISLLVTFPQVSGSPVPASVDSKTVTCPSIVTLAMPSYLLAACSVNRIPIHMLRHCLLTRGQDGPVVHSDRSLSPWCCGPTKRQNAPLAVAGPGSVHRYGLTGASFRSGWK